MILGHLLFPLPEKCPQASIRLASFLLLVFNQVTISEGLPLATLAEVQPHIPPNPAQPQAPFCFFLLSVYEQLTFQLIYCLPPQPEGNSVRADILVRLVHCYIPRSQHSRTACTRLRTKGDLQVKFLTVRAFTLPQGSHLLCSVGISGRRGSSKALGRERMAPEGSPTAQKEVKVYVHTNQPQIRASYKNVTITEI